MVFFKSTSLPWTKTVWVEEEKWQWSKTDVPRRALLTPSSDSRPLQVLRGKWTLLIKRQQKLIFRHNFYKSHWSVESNFFLICYPYQINWHQAILDGVLSPPGILNLKFIQNERLNMDLSLRPHEPAEFTSHRQARWFSHHCQVGRAARTLPSPPLHAQHVPDRAKKPLPPWGSSALKAFPPRGELWSNLQV